MRLGDSLAKGTTTLFELAQASTDLRALETVVAERSESHKSKENAYEKGASARSVGPADLPQPGPSTLQLASRRSRSARTPSISRRR